MLRTPDSEGEIDLVKFHSPLTRLGEPYAPANTPGLRHLAFRVNDIHGVVDGLRARGTRARRRAKCAMRTAWLCYVRGPEGSSSSWQRRSADGNSRATTKRGWQSATDSQHLVQSCLKRTTETVLLRHQPHRCPRPLAGRLECFQQIVSRPLARFHAFDKHLAEPLT